MKVAILLLISLAALPIRPKPVEREECPICFDEKANCLSRKQLPWTCQLKYMECSKKGYCKDKDQGATTEKTAKPARLTSKSTTCTTTITTSKFVKPTSTTVAAFDPNLQKEDPSAENLEVTAVKPITMDPTTATSLQHPPESNIFVTVGPLGHLYATSALVTVTALLLLFALCYGTARRCRKATMEPWDRFMRNIFD